MPGTALNLMGEARESDTIQDQIKDRTRVRGDGSTSWKRYSEDNRDKGRRGEAGIAEPRIQHGQILHIEDASRIKWRISSRKTQKKLLFPSLSLDKTITMAYFMVTKNRIRRFLSVNNRTLSQKRIDRGSLIIYLALKTILVWGYPMIRRFKIVR